MATKQSRIPNNHMEMRMKYLVFCLTIISLIGCGSGGDSPSPTPSPSPSPSTPSVDTVPDSFSFEAQEDLEPGETYDSNTVQISGINQAISVSISGGEFSIDGGDFGTADASISNGQTLQIRARSPGSYSATNSAQVSVGTTNRSFRLTTELRTLLPENREAESADLGGGSSIVDDGSASDLMVVELSEGDDSLSLTVPQNSVSLRIRYQAENPSTVSLANTDASKSYSFELPATGADYTDFQVYYPAAVDEALILSLESGNALMVDALEFIPTQYQFVSQRPISGVSAIDGIAEDAEGNLYLGGSYLGTFHRIAADGTHQLFSSNLGSANGTDIDSEGNIFVAAYENNAIYKFSPTGEQELFASGLNGPAGLAIDSEDNVYVALYGTGAATQVLKFSPMGIQEVYAQGGGLSGVVGVAVSENNRVFATNFQGGAVFEVTGGNVLQIADLNTDINMIDYAEGSILLPLPAQHRLARLNINTLSLDYLSGFSGSSGSQNGHRLEAELAGPGGVAVSVDQNKIYVFDTETLQIREFKSSP